MRVVTFKVSEDLLEELDKIARLKGMTRSEAIRRAIREWLERNSPQIRERFKPKVIKIFS